MRTYPKIDTLFVRDKDFKLTDQLRQPVLADIAKWIVTEKVDGMNIRVKKVKGYAGVVFAGRSDKAQIPGDLVEYLKATFTPEKMDTLFFPDTPPGVTITLFGEGYGAGIQRGAHLSATKSFILFDTVISSEEADGSSFAQWQPDSVVTEFAEKLGIRRVPILGEWDLSEIVDQVSVGIVSRVAEVPGTMAEGVVARTREPLFDKRGNRLILKLKTSDFK